MTKIAIGNLRTVLLAILVTLLMLTLYLVASRWPINWSETWTDWIALGVCAVAGAVVLNRLTVTPNSRLSAQAAYVAIALLGQSYFALVFVCSAFGDCL